ncbi:putative nucleotidyltransferase with HDIG domain [Bacillus pakistanensis]|uniref:Nucleotidyltransferase with HDIG domain n=1 Tax=Rossellomorea pakistanensis TaxID=992288 RepID=A0ABS2NA49_9BACI|nr:putative nucleotidyltransferase with HDIG domain [Bacillus pakistanensis]
MIFIILGFLLYGVLYGNVKPETYDINVFEESDQTIVAPKNEEDKKKTKEKREKAAEEVEPVYVHNNEQLPNRIALVDSIFTLVKDVNKDSAPDDSENTEDTINETKKVPTLDEKLATLKKNLTANVKEDITKELSDEDLKSLLSLSQEELERVNIFIVSQLKTVMDEKVYEEELTDAKGKMEQYLKMSNFSEKVIQSMVSIGRLAVAPTEIYNEELTEEKRIAAMEAVEKEIILEGTIIVREGEMVTHEMYRQLELLGLLSDGGSLKIYLGLGIFVFVSIGAIYYHFYNWNLPEERKQNRLILLSLIFVISLILMKIVGLMNELELDKVGFLYPAALAGMLIRIMLNERVAMLLVMILAACGSIVFHYEISGAIDIEMAMYILFSGLAGVLFLSNRRQRSNILQAGLSVSAVNVLIIFFLIFLRGAQYSEVEYMYFVVYAFVSGISSAVLTIGFLPFFEAGFGILSAMRLVELSNPNHPLLKKILTETPGTYHHSVMVANLAESACEAIGANGLLARVGCYYHDVGKTRRPHFFIENQLNMENPHDRLLPETSRNIIISHATDGAEMLRKHKLPKEFIDIAEQHHGTSLLKFFYHKAKEQGKDVNEEEYRYPGPKPQTKEIAIISIADSVEAAVRSMKSPTAEEIKKLVNNIVKDRLQDGQFDECDLTLKELQVVKKTLCETLNGIFHSRIEYPENEEKENKHESSH